MSKKRLFIIFVLTALIFGTVTCNLGAAVSSPEDWDWEYGLYPSIGNHVAPDGYSYAAAVVHIHNTGDKKISTNPYYWYFIADNITYSPNTLTFDSSFYRSSVNVGKGGKIDVIYIYLVKGSPSTASLYYKDPYLYQDLYL